MIYNEALLQFIWQFKLFDAQKIKILGSDELVQIIYVGQINKDAGPDFKEARIQIGSLTLVGDLEIHIKAKEWFAHKHQDDERYQKIIAHVVYEADTIINDKLGNPILCIELKDAIDIHLIDRYQDLLNSRQSLACAKSIQDIKPIVWWQQWEKMLTERLSIKAEHVLDIYKNTNNDWSETFYICIAKAFGAKVNSDAFEALATRVPLRNLARQRDQIVQIEAMLFGVAGLLPADKTQNDYIKNLDQEYQHLKNKYQLQSMDPLRWKFMRMRPPNFPTVRIAQFADLIYKSEQLFGKLLDHAHDIKLLRELFNCTASAYWDTHYGFKGDEHKAAPKRLGEQFQDILMINTVAPLLFAYGHHEGKSNFCKHAIDLLMNLPSEENNITKEFTNLGLEAESAGVSQGMIQLYNEYCSLKKCLQCSVGYSILKSK